MAIAIHFPTCSLFSSSSCVELSNYTFSHMQKSSAGNNIAAYFANKISVAAIWQEVILVFSIGIEFISLRFPLHTLNIRM